VIVTEEPEHFRRLMDDARSSGRAVGFHPTMGALHGGHRANIRQMAAECGTVAISIFVNPLQFGPGEDFSSYPRQLDADLATAEQAGAEVVFVPAPDAMFPSPPLVTVRAGALADHWEGRRRPGHFDGVATVVTKLLALAGPCHAYFGEKDYQQLVIVRRLVTDLSLPVVVVACPTVRETDGLAMSSRNRYLSEAERAASPVLYWSLLAGKRAIEEKRVTDAARVEEEMLAVAGAEPLLQLEYAAAVDPATLAQLSTVDGTARLMVAGRVGGARLIDNVSAEPQEA
jgi:pantoate--beta-alanine ligase